MQHQGISDRQEKRSNKNFIKTVLFSSFLESKTIYYSICIYTKLYIPLSFFFFFCGIKHSIEFLKQFYETHHKTFQYYLHYRQ